MAKIETPFVGGAYTSRSSNLNAQTCQNLYLETDQTGAKSIIALVGTPGCKVWKATGITAEIRALYEYRGSLYAVLGNTVYKFDSAKTPTSIGTLGTDNGFVDITEDESNMVLFDAIGGRIWDDTTFSSITNAAFPAPTGATYQDGYHIMSKSGTNEIYISGFTGTGAADPASWSALNFATVEGTGDMLVSPISVQRQVWLIGTKSTEVWYNSGATFPFERNPGGFMRIGCNAKRSIASYQDELMFLSDKNQVVRKQGLGLIPVSTYQIDYLISTMASVSDARAFMYGQEGHVFYEISFPTADKTLCYDLTTGFWHTRASGPTDIRSRANCAIRFNNLVLVGDFNNGIIYEYDLATFTDNGGVKRAIRTAQHINDDNNRIFFSSFELDMESGVGTTTTTAPQIMLQVSRDGGHTWGPERWKSMGGSGEYKRRVKWNRLGSARNLTMKVTISDPVKRNIFKAYLTGTTAGEVEDG